MYFICGSQWGHTYYVLFCVSHSVALECHSRSDLMTQMPAPGRVAARRPCSPQPSPTEIPSVFLPCKLEHIEQHDQHNFQRYKPMSASGSKIECGRIYATNNGIYSSVGTSDGQHFLHCVLTMNMHEECVGMLHEAAVLKSNDAVL